MVAAAVVMNNPEKVTAAVVGIDQQYLESHTAVFVFHYTSVACKQHFAVALVIGCHNDFEEATYDHSIAVEEHLRTAAAFVVDEKPSV